MNLSQNSAVVVVLFVTFLWGSWFQVVKHTGKYPIAAFINWMYVFSVVIVWGSILLLQEKMVPVGITGEIFNNKTLSFVLLICGFIFALGIQVHLSIVGRMGLVLSTSISATCSILCGTVLSSIFGGIPEGVSFASVFLAAVVLVAAAIMCQYAGAIRDKNEKAEIRKTRLKDIILLIFCNTVLLSSYPFAASIGISSPLNPDRMSSLTCMGILSMGAFFGSNVFTVVTLTVKKQWNDFFHPCKNIGFILFMAFLAACCHFGGNVLHAIVAPVISITIAITMGNSYHIWNYLWGIFYGEFKGASKKTHLFLIFGILLFIIGVLILSLNIYCQE